MFSIRPGPVPPPSIAVKLAINPPSFKLGEGVQLSVTAVSNASEPITIYTWPNIFNPELSQQRGSLVAFDQATLNELMIHTMDISRGLFNFTLGSDEGDLFITLEFGKPSVLKTPFAYGYGSTDPLPDHRYLADLQKIEHVGRWKKGRKEDVMKQPGKIRVAYYSDGKPIFPRLDEMVQSKMLPLDG